MRSVFARLHARLRAIATSCVWLSDEFEIVSAATDARDDVFAGVFQW